jgi:hypothetical protein
VGSNLLDRGQEGEGGEDLENRILYYSLFKVKQIRDIFQKKLAFEMLTKSSHSVPLYNKY